LLRNHTQPKAAINSILWLWQFQQTAFKGYIHADHIPA